MMHIRAKHIGRCLAIASVAVVGVRSAQAAPLLAVDVNDRAPDSPGDPDSLTQPGFQSYLLTGADGTNFQTAGVGPTRVLDGYSVTLAPAPSSPTSGSGIMDDRDRDFSLQPGSTMSYTEVYDDFVFNSTVGGGLSLTVSGGSLQPNTPYLVSIYAYDHASPGTRTANYVDSNNGDALVLTTAFTGGTVPFTNDSNKYSGYARTDSSGTLRLRGYTTSSTAGVFISGFEIAVPEPVTATAMLGLGGLILRRRRGR